MCSSLQAGRFQTCSHNREERLFFQCNYFDIFSTCLNDIFWPIVFFSRYFNIPLYHSQHVHYLCSLAGDQASLPLRSWRGGVGGARQINITLHHQLFCLLGQPVLYWPNDSSAHDPWGAARQSLLRNAAVSVFPCWSSLLLDSFPRFASNKFLSFRNNVTQHEHYNK